MNSFLNQTKQLDALIALLNKVGKYEGKVMTLGQWVALYKLSPEKAETLFHQQMAEVYVALASQFPTRAQLHGEKGDSIKGDKGDSVKGDKGDPGKDAPQMDELLPKLQEMVDRIELPKPEAPIVQPTQVNEITKTVYETIDFDVDEEITRSGIAIRNALELIDDEKEKLAQSAVRGLPARLKEIDKTISDLIEEIRKKGNSQGAEWVGTTWEEAEQIAKRVVTELAGASQTTFETINKNLLAYDVIDTTETSTLITITYDSPSGDIIKSIAFDANGDPLTITLSGATPSNIELVKTFDFTGRDIPLITYS